MKRKALSLITLMGIFAASATVHADVSYSDIYAGAVNEACSRHDQKLNSGELDPIYNSIQYTISDITGDGIAELIIRQVVGKHLCEYWVYGTNGSSSYYMGDFSCDAGSLYGYAGGILYEESYKGSLRLGLASYNGNGFMNTTLYEGSYDRDGAAPSIPALSYYYDSSKLLDEIMNFTDLTYGTVIGKSSSGDPHDLSKFQYRTVNTHGEGELVFQSAPSGSFMFDYQFYDGDQIYVNIEWREQGYALAYQGGVYGFVDASYIDW